MIDLITWLRAQLDEDERIAQAASAGGRWRYAPGDSVGAWTLYDEHWRIASLTTYDTKSYDYAARMPAVRHPGYIDADANGRHIARHDPASVLSDIAAKRAILDTFEEAKAYYDGPGRAAPAGEVHGLYTAIQHLANRLCRSSGLPGGMEAMTEPETCGVCRASHSCGLPPRHDGDHGCIDEDDNGEPHYTWARDDDHQYMVDLLRYHDGDFCDLCGPVDVTQYANPLLDHAMKTHPDLWAAEYAAEFPDYLGDGRWRNPDSESHSP